MFVWNMLEEEMVGSALKCLQWFSWGYGNFLFVALCFIRSHYIYIYVAFVAKVS